MRRSKLSTITFVMNLTNMLFGHARESLDHDDDCALRTEFLHSPLRCMHPPTSPTKIAFQDADSLSVCMMTRWEIHSFVLLQTAQLLTTTKTILRASELIYINTLFGVPCIYIKHFRQRDTPCSGSLSCNKYHMKVLKYFSNTAVFKSISNTI